MSRRSAVWCIALVLTGLLATACQPGSLGAKKKEPTVITVWCYYAGAQKTAFDELVQGFNSTEGLKKGIIVKAVSQSSVAELSKELIKAAKGTPDAQPMPDLFTAYRDTAMDIDAIKPLANLENYFNKEDLAKYYKPFIEEGRFGKGNELKMCPIGKSTEVLIVNKTLWEPFARKTSKTYENLKTWEDLIETAQAYYEYTDSLTTKKNDGKALFGRDSVSNFMYVGAQQLAAPITSIVNGVEKVELDKTVFKKLWDTYYTPYAKGWFFSYGRFASDEMRVGDIIAMVASTTSVAYLPGNFVINEKEVPVELDVLPVPNFKGRENLCVQQGAGIAVLKNNKQIENACCDFLKWFTQNEANVAFALKSSYMPVNIDMLDIGAIEKWATTKNNPLTDIQRKTLKTSIDQIKSYQLFIPTTVKNGFQIRQVIEKTLKDVTKADAKTVFDTIAKGADREKTINGVLAADHFTEWYNALTTSVSNLTKQ